LARLSNDAKEKILADFHTGAYSQRELAKKYGVSTATINKITKGLEPKHKAKVNAQISLLRELSEESEHEVNAFTSVIKEKTKHLSFFQNAALKNQHLANELLESAASLQEIEAHARITAKNKETVLGKDIETQVNIQNNNQNNQANILKIEVVE